MRGKERGCLSLGVVVADGRAQATARFQSRAGLQVNSRRIEELKFVETKARGRSGRSDESGQPFALPQRRRLAVEAAGAGSPSDLDRCPIAQPLCDTQGLKHVGMTRDARSVEELWRTDPRRRAINV